MSDEYSVSKTSVPFDEHQVRSQLISYLSRREHSESELKNKLLNKGVEFDSIQAALAFAQAHGLQSDQRFAYSKARDLAQRKYGPMRVKSELQSHNIQDDIIHNAIFKQEIDWFEVACDFAKKKCRLIDLTDFSEVQKLKRKCAQRGFTYDQIQIAVEQCHQEQP